jgi:hypothetical protein
LIENLFVGITITPPNKKYTKQALGAKRHKLGTSRKCDVISNLKKENIITLAIEQVESAVFYKRFCSN